MGLVGPTIDLLPEQNADMISSDSQENLKNYKKIQFGLSGSTIDLLAQNGDSIPIWLGKVAISGIVFLNSQKKTES